MNEMCKMSYRLQTTTQMMITTTTAATQLPAAAPRITTEGWRKTNQFSQVKKNKTV